MRSGGLPVIKQKPIHKVKNNSGIHRPLFVACSGGSGHIGAAEAIRRYMLDTGYCKEEDLPQYMPVLSRDKHNKLQALPMKVAGLFSNDIPLLRLGFRKLLKLLNYPTVPRYKELEEEVAKLDKSQLDAQGNRKKRNYVDMLLDVFPLGYQYVAFFNVGHRRFDPQQLKAMMENQNNIDGGNSHQSRNYFYKLLSDARKAGKPYSEVISTQLMGLPGLCQAVLDYNRRYSENVRIHQYMTDLPTSGCTHFYASLSQLSKEQRQVMYLYGTDMNSDTASLEKIENIHLYPFRGLFDLAPNNNPMLRKGFHPQHLPKIDVNKDLDISIQVTGQADKKITVKKSEKVACIMLGSLAAHDTIGFAVEIAKLFADGKCKYDKIFVFGGNSPHIRAKLLGEIEKLRQKRRILGMKESEIILLDNQDDIHSIPIRMRSDLSVLRGGGMTVMEEMAMPHRQEQVILFHGKRDKQAKFTSIVPWEDGNIDKLAKHLQGKVKKVGKTSLEEIGHELVRRNRLNEFFHSFLHSPPVRSIDDENSEAKIDRLTEEINFLREQIAEYDAGSEQRETLSHFVDGLDLLFTDLDRDIKQKRENLHSDKNKERKILKSTAVKLVDKTANMLEDLRNLRRSTRPNKGNEAIRVISEYEKSATRIPAIAQFGRAVAVVIAAALGFVLGAVICSSIGFFAGAWSGPGAVVTAIIGLFKGAATGWAIGLAVGTAATGLSTAAVGAGLLFNPSETTQHVKKAASIGRRHYSRTASV